MMQGGDTTAGNGTGGVSIYNNDTKDAYAGKFNDEGIWYPHTHKGVLSMANSGPNTNGSQFFICYNKSKHLNEKHTLFGRVIHNYSFIEKTEKVMTGEKDLPLKSITIVDCGELKEDDKLHPDKADHLGHYYNDKHIHDEGIEMAEKILKESKGDDKDEWLKKGKKR